jgi:hypothetical protein
VQVYGAGGNGSSDGSGDPSDPVLVLDRSGASTSDRARALLRELGCDIVQQVAAEGWQQGGGASPRLHEVLRGLAQMGGCCLGSSSSQLRRVRQMVLTRRLAPDRRGGTSAMPGRTSHGLFMLRVSDGTSTAPLPDGAMPRNPVAKLVRKEEGRRSGGTKKERRHKHQNALAWAEREFQALLREDGALQLQQ